LHSSWEEVPILYNGRPCTPQLPLPMRDLDPDLTHGSFGPYKPKGHVDQFDRSCTADCRVSLWFARFLIKIAHSYGESGPHVIHGSLRAPESSTKTATRSLQPFSQGSLVCLNDRPTDRPTDHATRSVTMGACTYVVLRCGIIMRHLCGIRRSHTLVSC